MATRKRRFKSLQTSPTSYSQTAVSEIEPPLKRRRLSFGNLSPNNHNTNNHRQNYLTSNLNLLRNDAKISDVTFVLSETLQPKKVNENNMNSNNNSLSEDEEQSICNVRKFHCIKALFAANSEVFKNLLYGNFNEARVEHPQIEIKDITISAFEYIRDLFYHFNPILTSDIVIDVAIAAHRYFIDELMIECINYLRNISNVTKWYNIIYEIQNKYNNCFGIETYLRALIDENYMVNNCTQIIFNDLNKLYALNMDILSRIIKSNNVYLSEELIWHKCVGYALHKTKQKFGITNEKIPHQIKLLMDKHLSIPKQIYDEIKNINTDKKEREYILSQVIDLSSINYATEPTHPSIQKNNIKNWERMIIKERDIYIRNNKKNQRNNGDIIIDCDSNDENDDNQKQQPQQNENDVDNHMNDMNDNENDEKDTEQENDIKFIAMFEDIMKQLSHNVRFTFMVPMFFIKLVQCSQILSLEKVVDIQNYLLCKVKPEKQSTAHAFITSKREKKYLKYFTEIQRQSSENNINRKQKCNQNNTNHNNNNHRSQRKSKFQQKQISESEEQKQDDNNYGHELEEYCENEYNKYGYDDDTFFIDEMCFDQIQFQNLSVDDHIDHRDNVGRFATAVIVDIDKNRYKVKLHYIGWQSKWDLWCHISAKCQQIRFCAAGSISTRQIHRSEFKHRANDLKDTMVKCRLAKYWYRNHPDVSDYDINEWRVATIKRVDKHSGQTQLVVRIGSKDYLWWVHLDSDEVKPYHSNNSNNIDLLDTNSNSRI